MTSWTPLSIYLAALCYTTGIVDTYHDMGKRIAERDAIDRKAEFVGKLGAFGLALAGLVVLAIAVGWVAL